MSEKGFNILYGLSLEKIVCKSEKKKVSGDISSELAI